MDTLRLPATIDSLEQFRLFALSRITRWGFPESISSRVDLILEEVLSNVVNYAYPSGPGDIELHCFSQNNCFCISIQDWGRVFNPLEQDAPDLSPDINKRKVGGLGIYLVRQCADDVRFKREGDANILTICFNPPQEAT